MSRRRGVDSLVVLFLVFWGGLAAVVFYLIWRSLHPA
jgi:phage shock protein PspC (stress-responsive transcriptional regulator)